MILQPNIYAKFKEDPVINSKVAIWTGNSMHSTYFYTREGGGRGRREEGEGKERQGEAGRGRERQGEAGRGRERQGEAGRGRERRRGREAGRQGGREM
jgi:hypothetical protein